MAAGRPRGVGSGKTKRKIGLNGGKMQVSEEEIVDFVDSLMFSASAIPVGEEIILVDLVEVELFLRRKASLAATKLA